MRMPPLLRLYRALTSLLRPFISLWLLQRARAGKEEKARLNERKGISHVTRPDKEIIWVHAASVGEALSALPFIERLCARFDNIFVVFTGVTVTSASVVTPRLPARAVHQYVPADVTAYMRRFLDHWRPSLCFFTESEIWPAALSETAARCPVILLNARMSERSFARWRRMRFFARELFPLFTKIFTQEARYTDMFAELGAKDASFIGNLKYDAAPLPDAPADTGKLLAAVGDRPLWLAASTHPGEEAFALAGHKKLKEDFPDILTIIVPRHPKRGADIAAQAREARLQAVLRGEDRLPDDSTDIYIADTMGELGLFYRITPVAFIGGSMVPVGGHNPLEAARLDCAVFFGGHTENFTVICDEMLRENAALRVSDEASFIACLSRLLNDTHEQEKRAAAALALAQGKKDIINAHIRACAPYFPEKLQERAENAGAKKTPEPAS